MTQSIRELFISDVTRDIPPVVYFHEQSPEKLASEVSEYIITGGWPENSPNHRRVPRGIHEEYVNLLQNILKELEKPGGPELPNAWISGFFGSGKSSFAKLLGLALDGIALPDGRALSEAWLQRNSAPRANELRTLWNRLRQKIDPIAVVFDIGSIARDNEHLHAAAIRQVQRRLGYSNQALVADYELKLERDGEWTQFETTAAQVLGRPWADVRNKEFAEEDFSLILSVLYPQRYLDPMAWITSRAGTHTRLESPEEAVAAIRDMLKFRQPQATLFLIIDEVSQYVLANKDRVDRLRAFATALGALKGRAWMLALGQQKLEEGADDSFLIWTRDRFPPALRVHLAPTNIRDVVHKRLLQKKPEVEAQLHKLFEQHRPNLKLYAYHCESVTPDEFAEVYPMLPGHIDLLLQITTALRTRSRRAQGDDQAIRGLLQLLGELFRAQRLADRPVGTLVSFDQIYEIQHTALDSDVQTSMSRIMEHCTTETPIHLRVAKVVALLELIQENTPTDARLIAQVLYDRLDCGNQQSLITDALENLRRHNLLAYSEKQGYKIQSSAGEEWERERRDIGASREIVSEIVQESLNHLMGTPEKPKLQGRGFGWKIYYSDGRQLQDIVLKDPREDAAIEIDFRYLPKEERSESVWIQRTGETALHNRLIWICGDTENLERHARDLHRSRAMVKKYQPRRESLNSARKMLLIQEESRINDLQDLCRNAVAAAWMLGRAYFRNRSLDPNEQGNTFVVAVQAAATRILPDVFPHFILTQIQPGELLQLIETELTGPSPKYYGGELGILEHEGSRHIAVCNGVVPKRIFEYIESAQGLSGTALLAWFSGPPYGYPVNVVKACIAGLLRAKKLKIKPEAGNDITAIRDMGVRDLFDKDRIFRKADYYPVLTDSIGPQKRARICKMFKERLQHDMERDDDLIADAVVKHFPQQATLLRSVQSRLQQLQPPPTAPEVFDKLAKVLENCVRVSRETQRTVSLVAHDLDTLSDGFERLHHYDAELTPEAIAAVRAAYTVLTVQIAQLTEAKVQGSNIEAAATRIHEQLNTERPWREISALQTDITDVRAAYIAERKRLLQWQEQQANEARARMKAREGFATLSSDQTNKVLRPIYSAVLTTTVDAIAPSLLALRDSFEIALVRAEEEADEVLDGFLRPPQPLPGPGKTHPIAPAPKVITVDLHLRKRVLKTEHDVDVLVEEIRKRLKEQVNAGAWIRLL